MGLMCSKKRAFLLDFCVVCLSDFCLFVCLRVSCRPSSRGRSKKFIVCERQSACARISSLRHTFRMSLQSAALLFVLYGEAVGVSLKASLTESRASHIYCAFVARH